MKFLLNPFASVIKNGMFHNWRGMIFGKKSDECIRIKICRLYKFIILTLHE